MSSFQLVAAGVGGQGILFVTRLLEQAALADGQSVIGAETHGMSQRGGSVVSHFKLGEHRSPLVRAGEANYLLGLDLDEAMRASRYLRRDGVCVVNCLPARLEGSAVVAHLRERGTRVLTLDADGIARELGRSNLSNTALLGRAAAEPGFPFSLEQLRESARQTSPQRYLEPNLAALERGYRADQPVGSQSGGEPS